MNWTTRAACAGHDTETFYPDPSDTKAVNAALAVCRTCPVMTDCLNAAVAARDWHGIQGGTTEVQRRTILRRTPVRKRATTPA